MGSAGPSSCFKISCRQIAHESFGRSQRFQNTWSLQVGPSKQDASLRKGQASTSSPTKKGSSELSPRKASTSNALRSINGKQRQPLSCPSPNLVRAPPTTRWQHDEDACTPQLGKARTLSRHNSFITRLPISGVQVRSKHEWAKSWMLRWALVTEGRQRDRTGHGTASSANEEEMYPEMNICRPAYTPSIQCLSSRTSSTICLEPSNSAHNFLPFRPSGFERRSRRPQ
ncbi:uncharacterized protein UTRI_02351 [Ustilago trichophora]|uniref:Uncharacterized protein n=1 Tax=Ustilago trichophora TaxID=86804 RepID=A0A5C3E8X4_9BASI|nr:uncharacterized protein UTRI_02351 [Ustilago trichophora]